MEKPPGEPVAGVAPGLGHSAQQPVQVGPGRGHGHDGVHQPRVFGGQAQPEPPPRRKPDHHHAPHPRQTQDRADTVDLQAHDVGGLDGRGIGKAQLRRKHAPATRQRRQQRIPTGCGVGPRAVQQQDRRALAALVPGNAAPGVAAPVQGHAGALEADVQGRAQQALRAQGHGHARRRHGQRRTPLHDPGPHVSSPPGSPLVDVPTRVAPRSIYGHNSPRRAPWMLNRFKILAEICIVAVTAFFLAEAAFSVVGGASVPMDGDQPAVVAPAAPAVKREPLSAFSEIGKRNLFGAQLRKPSPNPSPSPSRNNRRTPSPNCPSRRA